ncbi:hypothetical protein PG996_016031 [Apiospora saccharicola]|uniref:Uncharacterized protein n=1 Tax=Apiospora saccharicola TaxID=335842 RepID=A0ABR1TN24_9PEZI
MAKPLRASVWGPTTAFWRHSGARSASTSSGATTDITTNKPAWDTDTIGQQRRSTEPRARDPEEVKKNAGPNSTKPKCSTLDYARHNLV